MLNKFRIITKVIFVLFCFNSILCGCKPSNQNSCPDIQTEMKSKILSANPGKNVEISFGLNPDGICAVTVDFTDARDCDLQFLNNLNGKNKYDITIKGDHLTIPALTTSAIQYLTLVNTGDSGITWPSWLLSSELQFLNIQQLKSDGKGIRLPQCPSLKSFAISFTDNVCFDLQELKKYPRLEHLIIGQQIIDGKVTKNEIVFTNSNQVKLAPLNRLVIVGNCIGYQQFLKASNLTMLGFLQAEVDVDKIIENPSCISILSLKDCTVSNVEKLNEIKTLKKVKYFQSELERVI